MAKKIILIGMPGCGKSTVGRHLAKVLALPFYDADVLFTERYGLTPAVCIQTEGEPLFRDKERALLADFLQQQEADSFVLSCGGGVVERAENGTALKNSKGLVIYLDRPRNALAKEDRPLTARYGTEALYLRRHPIYSAWADRTISMPTLSSEELEAGFDEVAAQIETYLLEKESH